MESIRNRISIAGLGLAVATVTAVCYGLCLLVLSTVSVDKASRILSPLRPVANNSDNFWQQVPPDSLLTGFVMVFIFGWFAGAIIATTYNVYIQYVGETDFISENEK